ncbi:MAG: hypothetical protein AMJ54_14000, partial [Deltaproteobacteria bacterium SG8_13]
MTGKSPHRKPPGKIRRLFLVLAGVLLAAVAALTIGVVYLARNPSAVKPLVEKTLSVQTGASVRIERLNLGTDPLRLDAQGISVSPGGATDGFHLYAAALTVRANLSGSFGGRTLSIDLLRLENYTGRFTPQMKLPTRPAGRKPSLPGRLLQRLVQLLLFSDLAVQRVEALNGELVFTTAHQQARMTIASILSDPDGGVRLDADARLESDDGRQLMELPEVQVDIAPPGLTTTRSVSGRIQLSDGRIDGGRVAAAGLTGNAAIRYDRNLKKIDLAGLSLRARMATGFRAKEIRPNEFVASLQADASYQLPNAQLEVSRWSLDCENLLNLSGSARLQAGPAYPFRLLLTGGRLDAAGLMRQLAPSTDHGSMPLSISGPVDIVGDVEGRFGEPPEKWNGSLRASLDRMPLAFRANPYQVKGRVGGKVQLTGNLLD